MKYRRLGRTGLTVSAIGLGTMQFGGEWGRSFDAADVSRILGEALSRGINFIDTAECYGDHLAESLIGQALPGRRDDWIIATKFGHRFNGFALREGRWSIDDVQRQLDRSLRALRTDYLDLYQFHSGTDDVFDQPELWTMLNQQVRAGKVRYLGISIRFNELGYQVQSAQSRNLSAVQVRYNRLDREPEDRILPLCQADDLGVIARVPLASGYLTGKYSVGASFPPDDIRSTYEAATRLELADQVRKQELPSGVPMAQWALAWCLAHPAVACAIPGCKDVGQVIDNAGAAEFLDNRHPLAA